MCLKLFSGIFLLIEQISQGFLRKIAHDLIGPGETLFGSDTNSHHSGCFDGLNPGIRIFNPQAVHRWCLHETRGEDEDIWFRFTANDALAIGNPIKVGNDAQVLQHS